MKVSVLLARAVLVLTLLSVTTVHWPNVQAQEGTPTSDIAKPTEVPQPDSTEPPVEVITPAVEPSVPAPTNEPTVDVTETVPSISPTATVSPTPPEATPTATTVSTTPESADLGSGQVTIHVTDDLGTDILGACVNVFVDSGGGVPGDLVAGSCDGWDGTDDGVLHPPPLAPGDVVIRQINPPERISVAPDVVVTIAPGETLTFTLVATRWAQLEITVQTVEEVPLPGACFWGYVDTGGGAKGRLIAGRCDNADLNNDGHVLMPIPAGDVVVEQQGVSGGYLPAGDQRFHLAPGESASATFVNQLPTTLNVRTVDVWGDAIAGTVVQLVQTQGGDVVFFATTTRLGLAGFSRIPSGAYEVTITTDNLQRGFLPPVTPFLVTVADLEVKTLEVVIPEVAPKPRVGVYVADISPTSVQLYWVTDQKTIGEVEFGRTSALGSVAPPTPGLPATTHRIKVNGLRPGTNYVFVAVGHSPNGDVRSKAFTVRTAAPANTASIVVTNVRASNGTVLKSACWEVYADNGGALGAMSGAACDATDVEGPDGVSTVSGLAAGTYWVVESLAPKGYLVTKPRKLSVKAGQRRTVTIAATKGGATLHIYSSLDRTKGVPGACFAVFESLGIAGDGAYVGSNCDDFDGENDAHTVIYGLPPGGYNIYEYVVPNGVVASQMATAYIQTFDKDVNTTFDNYSPTFKENVTVMSIDALGNRLPGACYFLYFNAGSGIPGEFVRGVCDADDGHDDGQTVFLNVINARYVMVQVIAPPGYAAGTKTGFTKTADLRMLTVNQLSGGRVVKVTTVAGNGAGSLKGACYGLYRFASNGAFRQPVTFACDGDDGSLDGVTRLAGVPDGTFRLYQTLTPEGYATPPFVSVAVRGAGRAVTVRTNRS